MPAKIANKVSTLVPAPYLKDPAKTKNMKKHIVFDFDHTLADSDEYSFLCFRDTIHKFAPSIETKKLRDFFTLSQGKTVDEIYTEATKEFNLKIPQKHLLVEDNRLMLEGISKMPIFPFVENLLDDLKNRNKHLYVCTNRYKTHLDLLLQQGGITHYFREIISCRDKGHKKPDPTCLLDLIDKNGANKKEFIYFGDSAVDTEFAKNAGIDFIIIDQYLNQKNFFQNIVQIFS